MHRPSAGNWMNCIYQQVVRLPCDKVRIAMITVTEREIPTYLSPLTTMILTVIDLFRIPEPHSSSQSGQRKTAKQICQSSVVEC